MTRIPIEEQVFPEELVLTLDDGTTLEFELSGEVRPPKAGDWFLPWVPSEVFFPLADGNGKRFLQQGSFLSGWKYSGKPRQATKDHFFDPSQMWAYERIILKMKPEGKPQRGKRRC